MAELVNIGASGLWTNPSPLLPLPQGALKQAMNVCVYRPGQLDSRRGFVQRDDSFEATVTFTEFLGELVVHDYENNLLLDEEGNEIGENVSRIINTLHLRMQEADGRLLIAAAENNLRLMDDVLRRSGVPRALDGTAETNGDAGWMPNDSQVAYRIVWGYTSADGRVTLGAPSERIIAINDVAGGIAENVDLEFSVPPDVDDTFFFQVYRSFPSASEDITPNDELQLVFQRLVTSTEVSNLVATHTDEATIDLMGQSLYTNPSQEGLTNSNFRPPQAADIAQFANCTFFADVRAPHRIALTLLGNIPVAEEITFENDGDVYTASVTEDIPNKKFEVGVTAAETLKSLERVVNRTPSATCRAYVTNGTQLLLEALNPSTEFSITYPDAVPFETTMPVSDDTVTSTSQRRANVCAISKPRECEAVPLGRSLTFGRSDKDILRILEVQDALVVLKEDGAWRVTGTDIDNFVIEELDGTLVLLGRNTAVKFESDVVGVFNKGLVKIGPSGPVVVDQPIHADLMQLAVRSDFDELAAAVAYNAEKLYILSVPVGEDPDSAIENVVWRMDTESYTTWSNPFTDGLEVNSALVLAYPTGQLVDERKSFTSEDYVDFEFDVTITNVNGAEVTLSSAADAVIGMSLTQNGFDRVIVDIDSNVLTLSSPSVFVNGSAKVVEPIAQTVEWLPQGTANPRLLKQFVDASILCRDVSFDAVDVSFASNFQGTFFTAPLVPSSEGGFGSGPFGETPFGDGPGGFQPLNTWVPKDAQVANWLAVKVELSQAFRSIQLLGLELRGNVYSRSGR